jgi:hypothetical protein
VLLQCITSITTAITNQNQSPVVKPIAGDHKMTYISVVNGKKMIPRIGKNQLPPKAALKSAGRANQINSVPKRGNKPANIANKQGILAFSFIGFVIPRERGDRGIWPLGMTSFFVAQ